MVAGLLHVLNHIELDMYFVLEVEQNLLNVLHFIITNMNFAFFYFSFLV